MALPSDTDAALFERLRPRLTAVSRRIVGSVADAEDVVQDCFLKWHGADRDALATPAAWLTTVVRRQSIDRLRKRAREALLAQAAEALPPDAAPPPEDGLLRRDELGEALWRLLALSPAERLALVLHEAFECSHADIAAALGTNAANARQYLARGRKRLRAAAAGTPLEEKLCRALVLRFQAAINGIDLPAVASLLAAEQPASVQRMPTPKPPTPDMRACANDAHYRTAIAA